MALSRAKRKVILVASRSNFSLFSPDEETFANSLMGKNLLLRTCTALLWEGERAGKRVGVWGGKGGRSESPEATSTWADRLAGEGTMTSRRSYSTQDDGLRPGAGEAGNDRGGLTVTVRCKRPGARIEDCGAGSEFVRTGNGLRRRQVSQRVGLSLLLRLVLEEYLPAVPVVEIDVFDLPAIPYHPAKTIALDEVPLIDNSKHPTLPHLFNKGDEAAIPSRFWVFHTGKTRAS